MEFLALVIWLMLAGMAAIIAPFAFATPGAGLAALGAFGGTAACVLFIALGAPLWTAWTQLGLALVGILGTTLAVAQLSNDRVISGSTAEEVQAGVLGLALPFYFAVTFVVLLMAFEITDPVV